MKGYESYGKLAKTYTKMKDANFRAKATDFYLSIQIVGTPDDCVQQIGELRRLTGMDHLVTEFSFGSMPHHLAELNMRLFAGKVMPVLQRDAAFQGIVEPTAEKTEAGDRTAVCTRLNGERELPNEAFQFVLCPVLHVLDRLTALQFRHHRRQRAAIIDLHRDFGRGWGA